MGRRRVRGGAAVAVAGVVLAATPAAASAHAELVRTSPRENARVSDSLRVVRLTFSQQILGGSVRVIDPRNRNVVTSSGRDPRNVTRLRALLRGSLRSGRYTVRWSVRAADGHVQRGSYRFRIR
jgi:methionine-rich copper-binding protein CopC